MEETNFNNSFAEWQRQRVLSPFWSYSYVNNSQYYASIPAPYNAFMRRYVEESLFWNDGWNPHFHNADQGIFNTGLGGAIVKRLADKVFGAKLYYKNVSAVDDIDLDKLDEVKPNESVLTIMDWAEDTNFADAIAKAINFALAAGTSILKINKNRKGELSVEALRLDQAFPTVNSDGTVQSLRSVILANIPFNNRDNGNKVSYVVEEERYFGDYKMVDGTIKEDVPLISYEIKQFSGEILNGVYASSEKVDWASLPKLVKDYIKRAIPGVMIGKPVILPFEDLGVEIVKATSCIPSLPMLPFGESVLHKIIPQLQAFDYSFSALCTDMYLGRGRVLTPKGITSATDGSANSGLDDMIYEKIDYVNPDDQKPIPIQFDIRAEQWKTQAENLLNLIALNIGVSNITLASFLQDNTAAKTAREVSTQENETMAFVQTTRAVMERPINKILNRIRLYMGLEDKIAIRWSTSVMENPYLKAEMLSMAKQGGFISTWKAIQMFFSDDNDVQVAKEYQRVLKDAENNSFGNADYPDDEGMNYFAEMGGKTMPRDEWEKQFGEQEDDLVYDNKTTQSPSDSN